MASPILPASGPTPERVDRANAALARWLIRTCQSEGSRYVYKRDLMAFARFLADNLTDVFALTHDHVLAYMETLRKQDISAATRAKKLTIIRGFTRALADEGLLPYPNCMQIASLRAPKVSRDGRTPGLSDQETKRLMDAPDPDHPRGIRDRAILALMFYTGARVSAVCRIRQAHLVTERNIRYVLLHEKGFRQIRAPLRPEAWDRIKRWMRVSPEIPDPQSPYLFRPFNGKGEKILDRPMTRHAIGLLMKKHARKAGLRVERLNQRGICPHSARVTAITSAFAGGAQLQHIQELVGHKDPRNTLRYRVPNGKDAQHAASKIEY